jgi:hypothetical protein
MQLCWYRMAFVNSVSERVRGGIKLRGGLITEERFDVLYKVHFKVDLKGLDQVGGSRGVPGRRRPSGARGTGGAHGELLTGAGAATGPAT